MTVDEAKQIVRAKYPQAKAYRDTLVLEEQAHIIFNIFRSISDGMRTQDEAWLDAAARIKKGRSE